MLTYMSTQAQEEEYNIYWYVNDHLDTPQKLVDESGNIVNETYLTPFGEVALESETVRNNFRFPGQYHDREDMLYYNWNRYYMPSVGRYNRADPLVDNFLYTLKSTSEHHLNIKEIYYGDEISFYFVNPYSYASNSPLIKYDVHGLVVLCIRIYLSEYFTCWHFDEKCKFVYPKLLGVFELKNYERYYNWGLFYYSIPDDDWEKAIQKYHEKGGPT